MDHGYPTYIYFAMRYYHYFDFLCLCCSRTRSRVEPFTYSTAKLKNTFFLKQTKCIQRLTLIEICTQLFFYFFLDYYVYSKKGVIYYRSLSVIVCPASRSQRRGLDTHR